MEFRSGMLGAVLIVLSLIASAILGVVLNVDRSTITVEEPVYQSDITGLYQADKQPSYISYNPSSNYNGYSQTTYSDSAAVNFTESPIANNYPITVYSNVPYTRSTELLTFGNTDFTDVTTLLYAFYDNYDNIVSSGSDDTILRLMAMSGTGRNGYSINAKVIPLSTIYTKMYNDAIASTSSIPSSMVIEIPGTVHERQYSYSFAGMSLSHSQFQTDVGAYIFPNTYTDMSLEDKLTTSESLYDIDYLRQFGNGTNITFRCTFQSDTTFTLSVRSPNMGNRVLISNGDISAYSIYYSDEFEYSASALTRQNAEAPLVNHIIQTPTTYGTDEITLTYNFNEITKYIDTRYGVQVRGGEVAYWNNGYGNQSMDLTIKPSSQYSYTIWDFITTQNMDPSNIPNSEFTRLSVKTTPTGTTMILSIFDQENTETIIGTQTLGSGWGAYNIRINGESGLFTVQPIPNSGWDTFLTWSSEQQIIEIGTSPHKGIIYNVRITSNNTVPGDENTYFPYYFQISNTYVFLNTYGVIMIDPEIDILNWYPDNDRFMISFFKTAATGSSVKIGGTEYQIDQNEIAIPQNGVDVKINITDYTVTYILLSTEDDVSTWEITIESPISDTSATVQGTTTEIEMSGAWYFNSNYYIVEDVDKDVYEWNFGNLAFGINVMFLFMMGFLAIGTIAVWKLIPGLLTAFDIGIVIIAEIILFFIAG